jgi:hypothetical protein
VIYREALAHAHYELFRLSRFNGLFDGMYLKRNLIELMHDLDRALAQGDAA